MVGLTAPHHAQELPKLFRKDSRTNSSRAKGLRDKIRNRFAVNTGRRIILTSRACPLTLGHAKEVVRIPDRLLGFFGLEQIHLDLGFARSTPIGTMPSLETRTIGSYLATTSVTLILAHDFHFSSGLT